MNPHPMQQTVDPLAQLIEQENIYLAPRDLLSCGEPLYGIYLLDPKTKRGVIILEKTLKEGTPMYRTVLAEELGHHFTVPSTNFLKPYLTYHDGCQIMKDEYKALKWACDFLLPDDDLILRLRKGYGIDELAEHYIVTEKMIHFKLRILRSRGKI